MSEQDTVHYLDHAGAKRRYVLHTPSGLDPSEPAPAVVMLDGRGGTPWTAIKSTGWSDEADRCGFLAVYPEAIRLNPNGPQHFLDNPQMWRTGCDPVDDVGFLVRVLEDLSGRGAVDRRRIYFSGFSNGAAMCFRFASAHPDRVAAIGPVGGHIDVPAFMLPRAVPALFLFGGVDPINPVERSLVTLPWGVQEERPAVRETVRTWARMCGAAEEPTRVEDAGGILTEQYGPQIEMRIVQALGHVWPGGHRLIPEALVGRSCDDLKGTPALYAFFRRYALSD